MRVQTLSNLVTKASSKKVPIMKRIFVVGTSGSGKSTLAKYLSSELGFRHIELDALMWLPNWTKRDSHELKRLVANNLGQDKVISDGNMLNYDIELGKGDVLIFLDFPRLVVFWRILFRSIKRVLTREELWSGNKEEGRFLFSLNPEINPVLWSWKTHHRRRSAYNQYIQELDKSVKVFRVTNSRELRALKKLLVGV